MTNYRVIGVGQSTFHPRTLDAPHPSAAVRRSVHNAIERRVSVLSLRLTSVSVFVLGPVKVNLSRLLWSLPFWWLR